MNDEGKRHSDAETQRHGDKKQRDNEDAQSVPVSASPRLRVSASLLRLFYAVELSPEIRARAAEHIARLREKLPGVRASWERAEKLHITLKFLGDVAGTRTPALSLAAASAAAGIAPFKLSIADAGAFPPHASPRVLWLGVNDSNDHLARLQQALETECAAAGFKREERPFHPHLTIARPRQPTGTRALADLHRELGFAAMDLTVNEIVLMRSELGPDGSRYTALSRHGLSA
jgi:2'-5' RNA ligase